MKKIALLSLLALLPGAQAQIDDPLASEGAGLFEDPLVVGLTAGGLGIIVLAGAAYFLGVGGLRHIDKENVLEHPLRQSLMQVLREEPGLHLRELANRHETAVTNTQWHLRKLEMAELVRTQKVQGRRLYYPTEGGVEARSLALRNAALRNPNAQSVLGFIQANPGCNQRTVAESLHMNPGTIRWHLRRLEAAGLIRALPEGAQIRYFATDSGAERPPRPQAHPSAQQEQVEEEA